MYPRGFTLHLSVSSLHTLFVFPSFVSILSVSIPIFSWQIYRFAFFHFGFCLYLWCSSLIIPTFFWPLKCSSTGVSSRLYFILVRHGWQYDRILGSGESKLVERGTSLTIEQIPPTTSRGVCTRWSDLKVAGAAINVGHLFHVMLVISWLSGNCYIDQISVMLLLSYCMFLPPFRFLLSQDFTSIDSHRLLQ